MSFDLYVTFYKNMYKCHNIKNTLECMCITNIFIYMLKNQMTWIC